MRVLLIVYDNGSYISWFPQGLGYIASTLEQAGHNVVIYNQDLHHYPESHLTGYLNINKFDLVGVSLIGGYYQYAKLKKIAYAVNKASNRSIFKFVIGGHLCAPDPEYFLRLTNADCIIIGEGERAILDYIDNPNQRVIRGKEIKDIDSIPMPAYHLFPIEHYRLLRMAHCEPTDFVMPILSGRGCTFKCNFCYRLMKGFRPHSPEYIITEMKFLHYEYGINYFSFTDELLMSSIKRTTELCEAFLEVPFKFKWDCNGRLNYAAKEVLGLMKKAGCVFINYGIEAMDDVVLKNMNKHLTVEQINTGIENTLSVGISPGFNIIWGNIGDNEETLRKGVEFLLKYDDGAQMRTIRPVTPYPGSPLFDYAVEKGMIKDVEEFYEKKHKNSDLVSVNFTEYSDEHFHALLYEANKRLLRNYFSNKSANVQEQARRLYIENNDAFRGFR